MRTPAVSWTAGLVFVLSVIVGARPVRTADPVGVYCMIERLQFEPPTGEADRIQVWGVFAFADGPSGDGYGVVQRGYMYYSCPSGRRAPCKNDWEDLRWFSGTGKGVGYGSRSAPVGRLRKENEPPAKPDPYPAQGGIVKVESKDPAYVDLVARLKAAIK
jgi:hypothetical protein